MTMEEQITLQLAKVRRSAWSNGWNNLSDEAVAEAKAALLEAHRAEMGALLDRIEQSLNNHTTPEGHDLLTRSYIKNTLDFERQRIAELNSKEERDE